MTLHKILVAGIVLAAALLSNPAGAWNIQEDHGSYALIRCGDGSSATVKQTDDGYWTATAAGTHGQTGGHFPIIGKAAQLACGE